MVSDYCKIMLIVCVVLMLRFQLFLIAIQLLNPLFQGHEHVGRGRFSRR